MSKQGSAEWIAERLGKVTASRVADVVAKTKTGWGASRANYMAELIAERLTGVPTEQYTNAAMKWGIATEPEARAVYAFLADADVVEVGFVAHPTIDMTGASPDGLVGTDGLVEIKCPNTATHIDTLLGTPIPQKYMLQMQWQMACTRRAWCDWVSYDTRLPGSMRVFIQRVPPVDEVITSLEHDVEDFLAELSVKIANLRERYEGGPSVLMQQLVGSVNAE
jgi:putative phage-type endonuclease